MPYYKRNELVYRFARIFALLLASLLYINTNSVHAQTPDITPPDTSYTQTPSSPDGENGWYVSNVQIDLSSTDLESGVSEINYRIDGGAWQKVTFENTQNLAPNPSFEISGLTTSGVSDWEASVVDPEVTHSQDTTTSFSGYGISSAKLVTTAGSWHGINNALTFAPTTPYDNMTSSVWIKTQDIIGSAFFKVYAVSEDGLGGYIYTELGQSNSVSGTNEWTQLSLNYTVSVSDAIGVYLDVGLVGPGTVWIDAAKIDSSLNTANTSIVVGSDNENHTVEFYAVDGALNEEVHSCTSPKSNCIEFKLDQSPPTNWRDSGAWRGFFGPSYHLWVYAYVDDYTSGLSVFTDKYQIHTDKDPGFGSYSNILNCNSTWNEGDWTTLITPPFSPGANSAYILTPKTSFCNSNWNSCKITRFYIKDMAGNESTKDFCINGPWIAFNGEGNVRSNDDIDMIAEPDGDNTDGLIEAVGSSINFFTSSQDWIARSLSPTPQIELNYDDWWQIADNKTEITNGEITTDSGVYYINTDFTLNNSSMASGYSNDTFNKVVFINGNLDIDNNIVIDDTATLLFIVKGDVYIKKSVEDIGYAILADGDFDTAQDVEEGDATKVLNFHGIYAANNFLFKRTLQGTQNNDTPSEVFNYEPKYLLQLKDYFNNSRTTWKVIQ